MSRRGRGGGGFNGNNSYEKWGMLFGPPLKRGGYPCSKKYGRRFLIEKWRIRGVAKIFKNIDFNKKDPKIQNEHKIMAWILAHVSALVMAYTSLSKQDLALTTVP